MAQNILIPTDFRIESLNLLKAAATVNATPKRIILFHAIQLPDSITELLFFSHSKFLESIANDDFWTAVKIIRSRYASVIQNVGTELFVGGNKNAFENFIGGNQIDLIFIPESYRFHRTSKRSVDPIQYLNRDDPRTRRISWSRPPQSTSANSPSEVFQFNPELK